MQGCTCGAGSVRSLNHSEWCDQGSSSPKGFSKFGWGDVSDDELKKIKKMWYSSIPLIVRDCSSESGMKATIESMFHSGSSCSEIFNHLRDNIPIHLTVKQLVFVPSSSSNRKIDYTLILSTGVDEFKFIMGGL